MIKTIIFLLMFSIFGCSNSTNNSISYINNSQNMKGEVKMQTATFAAGCFWGVESAFKNINGVIKTRVGYTGGHKKNPSYEDVCTGTTGHAEAVQINFNPLIVNYNSLLEVFFKIHNPTTLNRQGPDVGSQYRSAIFYHNNEQKKLAINYIQKLQKTIKYKNTPIITQIKQASVFYDAEEYHQNYYGKRGINRTCHSY